ncbi:MAG TPA: cobyrinic acid a,c-diamide synthase [Mycobacteriales bacterium]|nr:cobyrinic acid a,c-diamide synthase [Mycobacteriales bacterium]
MSRRIALPGADELFRSTGDPSRAAEQPDTDEPPPGPSPTARALPEAHEGGARDADAEGTGDADGLEAASTAVRSAVRRRARAVADRRPSGRERHDEKITVYVSAEELMDLEHARLGLRGDFGLPVDRGRVVREALAVVLADFEAKGEASILVRRLRGR